MTLKLIGAILIVLGCSGFGFKIAAEQLRQENSLRQFINVLDFMECELQYRLTPLPELCNQAARQCTGCLRDLFKTLNKELENQISPDVERCMSVALSINKNIPAKTFSILDQFGKSLGRFDLNGQLKGITVVRQECRKQLNELVENKDVRLRSYKTLAICAGIALAILFI